MFESKDIPIANNWVGNLDDFYSWCKQEQRRLTPKGACGQSCYITNGRDAFLSEYPTFEDAYRAYKEYWERQLKGE